MEIFRAPLLVTNPKTDDWKYLKRQFDNYLSIVETSAEKKLPLFVNCLGRDGLDIYCMMAFLNRKILSTTRSVDLTVISLAANPFFYAVKLSSSLDKAQTSQQLTSLAALGVL